MRQECAAASQKVAAVVSKNKLKLKKSDEVAAGLKQKLSQEKERAAAVTSLANIAIKFKQQTEHGIVRSKTRSSRKSIGT